MGTYTTNYNLFMPTVGEQGWGDLVNRNFTTIDATMNGLNTRVGTLETEADAMEERVTTLEAGEFDTVNVAGTVVANVGNFENVITNAPITYNGDITADATSVQIATIPALNSASVVGATMQNTGVTLGTLSYPTQSGFFDISGANFVGDFYLQFNGYNPAESGTIVYAIYRNGVECATVSAGPRATGTVSIKIPYGDNSLWSCKYKSGSIYTAINGYKGSTTAIKIYLSD